MNQSRRREETDFGLGGVLLVIGLEIFEALR